MSSIFPLLIFLLAPDYWALKTYDPKTFEARAEYHYHLGQNLEKIGAYEEAIGDYNSALGYNPRMLRAIIARAEARCRLGRRTDADNDFLEINRILSLSAARTIFRGSCATTAPRADFD